MPKEYGTPGPRAIYPDICTSRSLAACSIEAQLLFDRLLAQADDQGRLEGDAAVIKSLCVPLVDTIPTRSIGRGNNRFAGIDELLAELEAEELVIRYSAGRSRLVQVLTWWRWQQGMRRAYPSRWPAPDGWVDAIYGHGADSQASYKTWISAAPRGTAPHNAAFMVNSPHNAAISGDLPLSRVGARLPAAPAAPAEAGASTVPDSPNPAERGGRGNPRANGTNPRAQGTNPRSLAKREAEARAEGEAARRHRRSQRQLAYARGAITEAQQLDMDQRDASLDEIPDYIAHLASLKSSSWIDEIPEPQAKP